MDNRKNAYDEDLSLPGEIPLKDFLELIEGIDSQEKADNLKETFDECKVSNWSEGILFATNQLPLTEKAQIRKWFGVLQGH